MQMDTKVIKSVVAGLAGFAFIMVTPLIGADSPDDWAFAWLSGGIVGGALAAVVYGALGDG